MRKLGSFVLLGMLVSQLTFGACEEETLRRDRAKKMADDWGKASEAGAGLGGMVAGIVVGCFTANPFIIAGAAAGGGLVCGGVPGLACARLTALYNYREEVLKVCLENDKNQQLRDAETQKNQLIDQHAKVIGSCLSGMFRNKLNYYTQVANTEINAKINEYIDRDEDLSDPLVMARCQSEIDAINRKYF